MVTLRPPVTSSPNRSLPTVDDQTSSSTYSTMNSVQNIDPNAAQDLMDELSMLSGMLAEETSVLSTRDMSPNVLEHGSKLDPGPPLFNDPVMLDGSPSFITKTGRVAGVARTARTSAETLVIDEECGTIDHFFDCETAVEDFYSADEGSLVFAKSVDASTGVAPDADKTKSNDEQKKIHLPEGQTVEVMTEPAGALESVTNRGTQGRLRLFSPHYVARKLFGPSSHAVDVELANTEMEFIINEASNKRLGVQSRPNVGRKGKIAAAVFVGSVVYLAKNIHGGDSVIVPCIMLATSVVVVGVDRAANLRSFDARLAHQA